MGQTTVVSINLTVNTTFKELICAETNMRLENKRNLNANEIARTTSGKKDR